MARHLERYLPSVKPIEFRIGQRVVDCLLGLPPPNVPIEPVAVQLNTGLASGPTMFLPYGEGLNALGYATVIVSPHDPSVRNHEDAMRVSEAILNGDFGYVPDWLSFATHSFGTRDTLRGLTEYADAALLGKVKDIVAVAPVGFDGVQGIGGAAKTVIHDVASIRRWRRLVVLGAEAFGYTARAGFESPGLIREARQCELAEETREVMNQGIGFGAVLYRGDSMVHHGPALRGLQAAGVEVIRSLGGEHTAVFTESEATLAAGLEVRDELDEARAARLNLEDARTS